MIYYQLQYVLWLTVSYYYITFSLNISKIYWGEAMFVYT